MNRRSMLFGTLAAGAAAPSLSSARARTAPSGFAAAWDQVAQDFRADLKKEGVVGGAVYFMHEGRVLGAEHYGFADAGAGWKVDADTIWHWASITKTFTSISLMQLRDRGLVSLDDPVVKHLPEIRPIHDPYGPIEQITIRHLMTHSSGLREPTFPWAGDKPWQPTSPKRWSQVAAMMPYTEIEFQPGSRYSYSNPGLSMVGRVVEEVSGQPITDYVDKNVLKPLGMADSYFDVTPYFLQRHRSNNYFLENGKATANGPEIDTGATVGNGGLNTPIPDFIKYTNFLLGIDDQHGVYETVLARKSLESMWTPLFPTDDLEPPQFLERMGTTFFLIDIDRPKGVTRYVGHTGSQGGFRSFFYVEPKSKTAVVWVVNSRTKENYRGIVRAERLKIFNTLFPLFTERA